MMNVTTFEADMEHLPSIEQVWQVSEQNFNALALQIFRFQAKNNAVYHEYLRLIDKDVTSVDHYSLIPFLPIQLFKSHRVVSKGFTPDAVFESSSTTGTGTSKHFIESVAQYHANAKQIIERYVGPLHNYDILGLLPHYLERGNSSLVSMVKFFIEQNQQDESFFLYDHEALHQRLLQPGKKLLFGVSYALLDFAEKFGNSTDQLTIIETGGMKGRKKEMTKNEVYSSLQEAFPKAVIRSEYGMTELCSQAYSNTEAIYLPPPWMKVLPRLDNDPLSSAETGRSSVLNIIDLANLHSSAFIATDDLGKVYDDGSFEVLGRLDYADIRGCSLMV